MDLYNDWIEACLQANEKKKARGRDQSSSAPIDEPRLQTGATPALSREPASGGSRKRKALDLAGDDDDLPDVPANALAGASAAAGSSSGGARVAMDSGVDFDSDDDEA